LCGHYLQIKKKDSTEQQSVSQHTEVSWIQDGWAKKFLTVGSLRRRFSSWRQTLLLDIVGR
jgi:hypothetical protein